MAAYSLAFALARVVAARRRRWNATTAEPTGPNLDFSVDSNSHHIATVF
jgi:hypothetical protein